MPRVRIFRRVLLSSQHEDGWVPAEREDGRLGYTTFSEGAATLIEYREDHFAELHRAMERRGR